MPLNPIAFTERVVGDFLRYELSTHAFADPGLQRQFRTLLSLEETRSSPLLKGPFISLSRAFRKGASFRALAGDRVLHPHLANLSGYTHVYGHQERAFRAIAGGKTTLISTGTGSGKTECFLYPIVSRALEFRDREAPPGIIAVIVYPMNALAEDQLARLRELLCGSGVTFGMYIGKTPEHARDVSGLRLGEGASSADYRREVGKLRLRGETQAVHPPEERPSREEMRTAGKQPRILLTNVKQLELLLTRRKDLELFDGASLDYLVFDEAHTFRGAAGAETACLVRRLRAFCGRGVGETICIATSATIADPERGEDAGREFAARFFGAPPGRVALVGEEYEPDVWAAERTITPPLPGDPGVHLQTILETLGAVEDEEPPPPAIDRLRAVFQTLTGKRLERSKWRESLHDHLSANEVAYQISRSLERPRPVAELLDELAKSLGRPVPAEEVLAWLALGAASRKDGRPLLRPVVHCFVRGLGGAVVTFPEGSGGPRLWLSAEDAAGGGGDSGPFRLPVTSCVTCGQHYFVHFLEDFRFEGRHPSGGEAIEDRVLWRPLDEARDGCRCVLLDRLVPGDGGGGADAVAGGGPGGVGAGVPPPPPRSAPVYLCRQCGSLHPADRATCDGCGLQAPLVRLHAVQQSDTHPGMLTSCLSCGAGGRRLGSSYREPARPLRAVTVADVHVLAQSMLQHAERRRLLVFADNRQDAAFQAGWMRDHARRYRLRGLMYERLRQGPVSVGDLTAWLDSLLEDDDELSLALVPEVWWTVRKESAGQEHAAHRKRFLRIQVLREITTGLRQRIGLEPWGRIRVDYLGLAAELPFIAEWARRLSCEPPELLGGIENLLDFARRNMILLDREGRIFTRFWREGDLEISRGYLPLLPGVPKGLKLRRRADDDEGRVQQWLSQRGDTVPRQAARAWGVVQGDIDEFFEGLWKLLGEELEILVPVTLLGAKGNALPNCHGVRQIDADKVLLVPHRGLWRCDTCRRGVLRRTPGKGCPVWRCAGRLSFEEESPEDYDLMVLDEEFAMIRPGEHSALVPAERREQLERLFKSEGERVNTLVATPTLELGVDIGALDLVLMRNVPPLPANYWQRAGRAGRRHRMAVSLTYARPVSHDRAYFASPLSLLLGLIEPPRFNLKNDIMVGKHVHAAVLTTLEQLAREGSGLSLDDRREIAETLDDCFPPQVKTYLFDPAGHVRQEAFDLASLEALVTKHEALLARKVEEIFAAGWPETDRQVVAPEELLRHLRGMGHELDAVLARLRKRLHWALEQMRRLELIRTQKGTLDPDEDALMRRCDNLVKRLKGQVRRRRSEAEGVDDVNTYGVLAAEGFLPGYGLDTGAVVGSHLAPKFATDLRDWDIRRALAMALREFVPGNLIYANGHRFFPRYFHLEAVEPTLFQVDVASQSAAEVGAGTSAQSAGMGASVLPAVPVCDVELPHQSHISDDEEYRFQLPVSVYGHEQGRHGEGQAYSWEARTLTLRKAVSLRLLNVGAAQLVAGGRLGYPVCLICGQSRSPLSSQADRDEFSRHHLERCGRPVENLGFYADITADALSIAGFADRTEGYSVLESLRQGAAQVLEMEIEDLQLLALGSPGTQAVDMLLYDPMPGGSGLLEQMVRRWREVAAAAARLAGECPAVCETACIECLLHFRNAYYHRYLDRHRALERLRDWGEELTPSHPLPARLPRRRADGPAINDPEATLAALLRKAGLHGGERQRTIDLGRPLGGTEPDVYFEDPSDRSEGICVYLDGMSEHLHGGETTRRRDRRLREELRQRGYQVIEIPKGHLEDREAMRRHFYRLGRLLVGKAKATQIRDDAQWFDEAAGIPEAGEPQADRPDPSEGKAGAGEGL
jgi:hypothetical protein